jgi:hypothetical protein
MTVHQGRLLTAAIISAIEADDWIVGEGIKPENGEGWQGSPGASTFVPYVVVYPTPGGTFDGSLADPYDMVQPDYVIHAIGATQQQCQLLSDALFDLLTSATLTVAGRSIQMMRPDVEGGVVRDDDAQPPLYYAPARWRVWTTTS